MPGASVRWRLKDERFEVIGHGTMWFGDHGQIVAAAEVAEAASLTEMRRALDRYRQTMYDGDVTLELYDVSEDALAENEELVSPREIAVEFAPGHTFLTLTLAVDPADRFDRHELTAVLHPQLKRHRAVVVELSQDVQFMANVARLTVVISPRGRTIGDAMSIGEDLYRLWLASFGGGLSPATVADLVRAGRAELLIGQPESEWFEAKSAAYAFGDDLAEIELAKDISAMANQPDGGLVVIGLKTAKRAGVDTVKKVSELPVRSLRPTRYFQALDKWMFPAPEDLVIEVVETVRGLGILFVLVPPQPPELRPFLVVGAIREDKLLGNHFSLVRRRGDDTTATKAAAVHGLLVAGRAALGKAGHEADGDQPADGTGSDAERTE